MNPSPFIRLGSMSPPQLPSKDEEDPTKALVPESPSRPSNDFESWEGAEWTSYFPITEDSPSSKKLPSRRIMAKYSLSTIRKYVTRNKAVVTALLLVVLVFGLIQMVHYQNTTNTDIQENDGSDLNQSFQNWQPSTNNHEEHENTVENKDDVDHHQIKDDTDSKETLEQNDAHPKESDEKNSSNEKPSKPVDEQEHHQQGQEWSDLRLPSWILPNHYDIKIDTSLDSFEFHGQVDMHLNLKKPSKFIVFHAASLSVKPLKLEQDSGPSVSIHQITENKDNNYWIVSTLKEMAPGNVTLSVGFNGTLNDALRGYYRSKIDSPEGEPPRYIATTQFESTDARRAFPCLDEPGLKATFKISLVVPAEHHALSNMPTELIEDLEGGRRIFHFLKTKRMATYLIAFVISDFEKISSKTQKGVEVSIWTQKGKTNLGKYALRIAVSVLEFYEKTYGVDYPLPKSDHIAIPDFAAGAMENWGLITYRDTALLYDPTKSSAWNKQSVAEVIAHELAHQWFGNLVTMEWWSDIWLNEGFAEFMEYKGTADAEPDWYMSEQFVFSEMLRALRADQSAFTHSIATNVSDPTEIQEIFDDISYGKGAAVLGMLEAWLNNVAGANSFFDGLQVYLKAHAYSNAKTKDLWNALSSSEVDVNSLMSTWINQPGFPVVILTEDNDATQERFYFSSNLESKTLSKFGKHVDSAFDETKMKDQVWAIPFIYCIYTPKNGKLEPSEPVTLIIKEKGPIHIDVKKGALLLGNIGRAGVYRVQYPLESYRQFSLYLQKDIETLSANDRAGLLTDAFTLSWSGRIHDVSVPLNLTRFLKNESDSNVWSTVLSELRGLEVALVLEPCYGRFRSFFLSVIDPLYKNLGWKEETENKKLWHVRALLRNEVLSRVVALKEEDAVDFALEKFELIKNGTPDNSLPVDSIEIIYEAAVKWGTEDDFDWICEEYKKSTFATEKSKLLHAMASANRPHLLVRTLNFAISGNVRKQDMMGLITSVAVISPLGHLYTWNWLRSNWVALIDIWKNNDFTRFNDMLQAVVSRFTQSVLIEEAEFLFLDKKDPNFFVPPRSPVAIAKGLEKAKQKIAFLENNRDSIEEWLIAEGH